MHLAEGVEPEPGEEPDPGVEPESGAEPKPRAELEPGAEQKGRRVLQSDDLEIPNYYIEPLNPETNIMGPQLYGFCSDSMCLSCKTYNMIKPLAVPKLCNSTSTGMRKTNIVIMFVKRNHSTTKYIIKDETK